LSVGTDMFTEMRTIVAFVDLWRMIIIKYPILIIMLQCLALSCVISHLCKSFHCCPIGIQYCTDTCKIPQCSHKFAGSHWWSLSYIHQCLQQTPNCHHAVSDWWGKFLILEPANH
jgi:hypothetical protein